MSRICQITGKKAMVGNNVSHSKRRTKRTFDVNLFTKKFFYVEENCWISLKLSAAGLRIINKKGLDAALKQAVAKGYCDWKDIKEGDICVVPRILRQRRKIVLVKDRNEYVLKCVELDDNLQATSTFLNIYSNDIDVNFIVKLHKF